MAKKTKEQLKEIEAMKDLAKKEKEELKRKEREDRFMSHFEQIGNKAYPMSDEYTQLEHVLGNIHKFTDRGFSEDGKLHPGDEFFILINRDQNDPEVKSLLFAKEDYENKSHIVKTNIGTKNERLANKLEYKEINDLKGEKIRLGWYRVVKEKYDESTGLNCAVFQHIRENGNGEIEVIETILWADGSKGFNNFWEASGLRNKKVVTKELFEDWLVNNLETALGKVNKQTEELYKFVNEYNREHSDKKIDTAIGVSLAALAMGTLGHTKLFESINVKAHSGVPSYDVIEKAKKKWGDNELNGSNIEYYLVKNEILFQILRGYFDDNAKLFIKDKSNYPDMVPHGSKVYNNKKGEDESYHLFKNIKDFPLWKIQTNRNKGSIPIEERKTTNDFNEFLSDPERFVYKNDNYQNNYAYDNQPEAVSESNLDGAMAGGAAGISDKFVNPNVYNRDSAEYPETSLGEEALPTSSEANKDVDFFKISVKELMKHQKSFSYDVNANKAEDLSTLTKKVRSMTKTIEDMQRKLDYHEKVVNIYNTPELAEFYLYKPVENILASILEDYCLMEGIDIIDI